MWIRSKIKYLNYLHLDVSISSSCYFISYSIDSFISFVCKEFRTSYGTREWIANDLTAFARQHPYVVIYVQPRRHRPPNLIGEYLSGDRQWIPLSNCDRDHVNWWIHSLLTQQGDPQWRLLKQMHTDSPSIQGIWTPFTNKSLDRTLRTYPDPDLIEMEYPQMTATEQIQELFEQQKTK
jgi:large subunit ribosomal protein L43